MQRALAAPNAAAPRELPPTTTTTLARETRLIADVRFEPEQPCTGDDVLVRTELMPHAHGAKVFVAGRPGALQLVRARSAGRTRVRVLASQWNNDYELREASFVAHDCDPPPQPAATIHAELIDAGKYVLALTPSPRGEINWEFGDGTRSTGNPIVHRYAPRSDRPYSSYLVSASAAGLRARAVVTHVEPLALAERTAFPVLASEAPRFVAWSARHGISTRQRIHNHLPSAVDFAAAELQGFPCNGAEPRRLSRAASEVLADTRVEAHASLDTRFQLDADSFDTPICELLVRLAGPAGERLATTTLSLETGVPDRREPIDAEQRRAVQAIVRARGHGGTITAEELALYRAGVGARQ